MREVDESSRSRVLHSWSALISFGKSQQQKIADTKSKLTGVAPGHNCHLTRQIRTLGWVSNLGSKLVLDKDPREEWGGKWRQISGSWHDELNAEVNDNSRRIGIVEEEMDGPVLYSP